jgi:hypothetical protein
MSSRSRLFCQLPVEKAIAAFLGLEKGADNAKEFHYGEMLEHRV